MKRILLVLGLVCGLALPAIADAIPPFTLDAGAEFAPDALGSMSSAGVTLAPPSEQPAVIDPPAAVDVSAVQKLWRSGAGVGAIIVALYLLLTQLGKLDPKRALLYTGCATALAGTVDTVIGTGASPNLSMLITAGVAFIGIVARYRSLIGPQAPQRGPTLVSLMVGLVLVSSCGPGSISPVVGPVVGPIVECAEQAGIGDLIASWITRRPSTGTIKDEAITAGINLGGCAFAKYINILLTPKPDTAALPAEQANELRDTFESYRVDHANKSGFRFGEDVL